ncbi:right-handed parallel beta-helix repeat-containing protein [Thermomonospora umbrina]|nr:right-handed parallel beta-helix repeat-containing protein [Thermomonospora umbrina]
MSRRGILRAGMAGGAALLGGAVVGGRAGAAVAAVNPYPAGEDSTVVALRRALDFAADNVEGPAGRDDKGRIIVRARPNHRHVLRATLIVPGNTFLDCTDARFVADFVTTGTARTMVLNRVPAATTGGYSAPGNIRIAGGSWDPTWHYLQGVTGDDFDTARPAPAMNVITMQHTSNVELDGLTIYNVKWWHAIELNAVRNATVRNCRLHGWVHDPGQGLWHGEAVQLDLAGSGNTWAGARDNTPCTDIRIVGNLCDTSGSKPGWGTLAGSHTAVDNVRHSRVWIESNTVRNTRWDAITPFNTELLYVRDNQITGCHGGVYVRGANSGVNPLTTVEITGNSVGPLTGTGRWGVGLAAYTETAPLRDVLVSGNAAPSFRYNNERWIGFRQEPQRG